MARNVLVLGASSKIAQAVMQRFAAAGDRLFLVGRSAEKLAAVRNDLLARGAGGATTMICDPADSSVHAQIIEQATAWLQQINVLFVAYGSLPDQAVAQSSAQICERELVVNFTSIASFLVAAHARVEQGGSIIILGSVAGDRGRRSNFVYGSAKAGLEAFASGLRALMRSREINVLLAKPGFVDTPMTSHLKKSFLFADADGVGARIFAAYESRAAVLYVPWFWRPIMGVIRLIPEFIFKRLDF